jgi:hypothetical protein
MNEIDNINLGGINQPFCMKILFYSRSVLPVTNDKNLRIFRPAFRPGS